MHPIRSQLLFILIVLSLSHSVLGQSTKLMSFNIRYDNQWDIENNWMLRRDKITKLINRYQPSIVATQEALSNQVNFLDSTLSNYSYIGIGREDGKQKGEFCAIFYNPAKYKVIKQATFWLSETPDIVSVGWDAALERICTYALFENINTKEQVYIFNAHFDHQGKVAQENSARLILKKIEAINKEDLPVVLMGDLNVTPEEKTITILKEELTDAITLSSSPFYGPKGTFNAFKNEPVTSRIDYCFVKNIKVLSYSHIDDRLDNNKHISDHYPVLVEIGTIKK
ncbi:endonuclease/exonuclease/phosphatase family metal-dependent hydrolase [Ancylomarina subtilis]|uniref:Endonuclease/exonuclease/phosphatase family metal-dependent hydrolase n=1 Tax=Ancylomarina subtilis TaxID=1639035 RepID=A0A4Q7V5Q0_9BACT|nr:endonuclease/exonuclease/phosphatase family protein [Ancylomarina subtilis]RZT91866.1 endonuclease/exonuclease/phosphatase family metal-dependent hydrolase [Ancylomarina subtilis]